MKQLLVQLDDGLAAQLEELVPGRSHKRSAFVRRALARAVQEELERRTREAYEKWPDEDAPLDPQAWAQESEALHPVPPTPPKKKATAKANATRASRSTTGRARRRSPR